jgi:hypothetical protein
VFQRVLFFCFALLAQRLSQPPREQKSVGSTPLFKNIQTVKEMLEPILLLFNLQKQRLRCNRLERFYIIAN